MIDTVILTIPYGKFTITDHSKFVPNTTNFEYGTYERAVNNPTKEYSKYSYYPRMTLYKRFSRLGLQIELRIEFSAPKILYNNNLDELEEGDFLKVVDLLQKKIEARGVKISLNNIENASVSAFHPSKNIQLFGYYTATSVIKELSKIDLTKRLDLAKTTFKNEGYSLQYYSNSHSLVFYDKIADMNKAKGRAMDKDKTVLQLDLFKSIQEMRRFDCVEILKMEVLLSKKKKMNKALEELGYVKNPTFRRVFRKKMCQKILLDYWKIMIEEKNSFIFRLDEKDIRKDLEMIFSNSKKKAKDALFFLGVMQFIKQRSVRELRNMIEDRYGKNGWARFPLHLKELDRILRKPQEENKLTYAVDIKRALDEFEAIRSQNLTNPIAYADNLLCKQM